MNVTLHRVRLQGAARFAFAFDDYVSAIATDKFRDGVTIGATWTDPDTSERLRVRDVGRYPLDTGDGHGEEYKYIILFDEVTVDLATAPDPEWALWGCVAPDIRRATGWSS